MVLLLWTTGRLMRLCTGVFALTVWWSPFSFGQTTGGKAGQGAVLAEVPFVGCLGYGQSESYRPPTEPGHVLRIERRAAQKLAYYQAATGPGVLGPRGWSCLGSSGSGGSHFLVMPEPINIDVSKVRLNGSAIEVVDSSGENSGRFDIADVIARVFPTQWAFARRTVEGTDLSLQYGPYPKDQLTYRGDRVVEYRTPPNSEGLGTMGLVQRNDEAIYGVAILQGQPPDSLLRLGVRLPGNMKGLESQIIQYLEAEAGVRRGR